MAADLEEHLTETVNKFLDASYGLWNALLTVNGIILAVFGTLSGVRASGNAGLIRIILGSSLLSSGLLILNYVMRKESYSRMVGILSDKNHVLSKEEMARDNKWAVRRHNLGVCSETAAIAIFFFEGICLAIFSWSIP